MPDLLVVCPTLRRPANVARLRQSYMETATGVSDLEFVTGEQTCVEKVNGRALDGHGYAAVMFVGDDHVFTQPGWDKALLEPLSAAPGIVWPTVPSDRYCHPTVWAMSTRIIRALGWMMLPTQRHYYVDDAIAQIGIRAGCATWAEDVEIPHLHPALTGGPTDEIYDRARGWLAGDRRSYWRWLREDSEECVARVRAEVSG